MVELLTNGELEFGTPTTTAGSKMLMAAAAEGVRPVKLPPVMLKRRVVALPKKAAEDPEEIEPAVTLMVPFGPVAWPVES